MGHYPTIFANSENLVGAAKGAESNGSGVASVRRRKTTGETLTSGIEGVPDIQDAIQNLV